LSSPAPRVQRGQPVPQATQGCPVNQDPQGRREARVLRALRAILVLRERLASLAPQEPLWGLPGPRERPVPLARREELVVRVRLAPQARLEQRGPRGQPVVQVRPELVVPMEQTVSKANKVSAALQGLLERPEVQALREQLGSQGKRAQRALQDLLVLRVLPEPPAPRVPRVPQVTPELPELLDRLERQGRLVRVALTVPKVSKESEESAERLARQVRQVQLDLREGLGQLVGRAQPDLQGLQGLPARLEAQELPARVVQTVQMASKESVETGAQQVQLDSQVALARQAAQAERELQVRLAQPEQPEQPGQQDLLVRRVFEALTDLKVNLESKVPVGQLELLARLEERVRLALRVVQVPQGVPAPQELQEQPVPLVLQEILVSEVPLVTPDRMDEMVIEEPAVSLVQQAQPEAPALLEERELQAALELLEQREPRVYKELLVRAARMDSTARTAIEGIVERPAPLVVRVLQDRLGRLGLLEPLAALGRLETQARRARLELRVLLERPGQLALQVFKELQDSVASMGKMVATANAVLVDLRGRLVQLAQLEEQERREVLDPQVRLARQEQLEQLERQVR
jgi:hypothetical protein